VSPDGSRIVFVHGIDATTIYLADSPLNEPAPVVTKNLVLSASLSPDGDKLALLMGGRGHDPSLSIMNLSDGSEKPLSLLHAWRIGWCPDERFLLAAGWARETDDNRIWKIATGGGLPLSLTPGTNDFIDWPDLSHDGRYLSGAREANGEYELFVRDLGRKTERILARSPHIVAARWSPDDRFIAWSGERRPADTMSGGIWIVSADGSDPRRLSTDGAYPKWEKDGESLVFVRYEENAGLWRISRNGGNPEQLQGPIESAKSYKVDVFDMNNDNSTVLISVNKSRDSLYMIEDLNL
jgi:Tol biopolymer transport system component